MYTHVICMHIYIHTHEHVHILCSHLQKKKITKKCTKSDRNALRSESPNSPQSLGLPLGHYHCVPTCPPKAVNKTQHRREPYMGSQVCLRTFSLKETLGALERGTGFQMPREETIRWAGISLQRSSKYGQCLLEAALQEARVGGVGR